MSYSDTFERIKTNEEDISLNNEPADEEALISAFLEENDLRDPSEEEILVDDIVKEACGKNANGTPKSAITFAIEEWSLDEEKTKEMGNQSSDKAEITILKRFEFIQVDLRFGSYTNENMRVIWALIEKFGKDLDAVDENSTTIPFAALTIVPLKYEGRYYIVCSNPIFWTLQPSQSSGRADMLRIMFRQEDVDFFETDEIDNQAIQADVERTMQNAELMAQKADEREKERSEYEAKRNAQLEEMRRNGNN